MPNSYLHSLLRPAAAFVLAAASLVPATAPVIHADEDVTITDMSELVDNGTSNASENGASIPSESGASNASVFDAGLKGGVNYDALGAHGNTQAPCVSCDLNSLPAFGHPSFYFRRIEQIRDVQVRNGDANRQVWLLEFGWTSDQIHQAYSWFAVSEDQKAKNVVEAFQFAKANWSPWIGVMTLWTLTDPSWPKEREEYWWAITNGDGSPRQAYTAVKAARQSGLLG